MAPGVRARLTTAGGRRFGLTVGGALLVLAAIAQWRGHPASTLVFGVSGGALSLAGLLIPTRLGPIERAWMRLAHAISSVTTPIAMGLIYLIVLTPIGFLRRTIGGNPLVHRAHDVSYWKARPEARRSSNLKRQF